MTWAKKREYDPLIISQREGKSENETKVEQ